MRNWIKKILGINKLEDDLLKSNVTINTLASQLREANSKISVLQSLCNVGVDVHANRHREDSWAVVCIKGKPEYVNFVRFGPGESNEIRRFLRNFEKSDITIDLPYGWNKKMFI